MSTTVPGKHGPQHREQNRKSNAEVPDSSFVEFARRYGWRAYAIPVLAVITVWVLIDVFFSPGATPDSGPSGANEASETAGGGEGGFGPGPDPADSPGTNTPPTALPAGGDFTQTGEGSFRSVGAPGRAAGAGKEILIRYIVEVENGVDTATSGGDDAFATMVDSTLTDPRGWSHDPRFRFEHVAADADPNLRIRLASVDTTHEFCGNDLEMETSCRTTLTGENLVMINDARWTRGADTFEGDLGSYRQYLINHEVGHAIGYQSHVPCGQDRALAPIMMQQTLSLNNSQLHDFNPAENYPDNDATCRFNGWPYPEIDNPTEAPAEPGEPGAPPADALVGREEGPR